MTRLLAAFILAAFLAPFGACADDFAIVHARVFTMTQPTPIEDGVVIVRGGTIAAVGAALDVPAGMAVVDAEGAVLTPGFMNGASQLGLVEMGTDSSTTDGSVTAGALGADFAVAYAVNANSTAIALARSDGLTRAAILPQAAAVAPFAGAAALIALHDRAPVVTVHEAAVVVAAGGASLSRAGGSRAAQWVLLRQALEAAGAAPPTDEKSKAPSPLARVLARVIPLVFVTDRESDIANAVEFAKAFGFRPVIVGGSEAWRLAGRIAEVEGGVVLDPIINIPYYFDKIGTRPDAAAILAKAGVPVALMASSIHTTYNAGLGIRESAGDAVASGLSPDEALRALTVWPAQIWGLNEVYGRIAPGYAGDLVLWDGDPLEPGTQALRVWIDGAETGTRTRQDLLSQRYLGRLRRAGAVGE